MSDAAKCGLPEYRGSQPGIVVYAGKVTSVEPCALAPGAVTIHFAEIDSLANLEPKWVRDNVPQVGGYFVVPEGGGAAFMHAQQFEREFSRAAE